MCGNSIVDDGTESIVMALSKGLSKVLMNGFVDGGAVNGGWWHFQRH